MFTTLLAFLAMTNPTAVTCATISNHTNSVEWTTRAGNLVQTTYEDRGNALMYGRPVPKQVRQAEEALQYGKPGPKTITVCS